MSTKDEFIIPLRPLARWAGVATLALSFVALTGWTAGLPILTQGTPAGPPMLPVVAVAFLLLAFALLLLLGSEPHSATVSLTAKTLAWAALALAFLGGSDLAEWRITAHHIATSLLPFNNVPPEPDPGFRSGLSLVLLPIAVLLFKRHGRWSNRFFVACTLLPILAALLALIGHACRLPSFYGWIGSPRPVVSLPGAGAAILMGTALFAARPDLEVTRMVAGRTFGGYVARWLLLTPVVIPLFNGLLLGANTRSRSFGPDLAGWFFSFSNILLFTLIIGLIALLLHRMDLKRRQAEETVRKLNESLEDQVLRRTDDLTRTNLRLEQEIQERIRTEQQLLRTQRVECIGAITGGIAHDLNNTLSPIQLACNLIETEASPRDSRALLQIIAQSVQRGSDLIRQLLTFARGTTAHRQPIDIPRLLADFGKTLTAVLPRPIRLTVRTDNHLPPVHGDPTQIYQVLMNLAINARDAMPNGGELEILATLQHPNPNPNPNESSPDPMPTVRISVRDTGIGIPPEHLPNLFEAFFTTKDKDKGTGLGLATVKRIVERHGGSIDVASTPGIGTTFAVTLPCAIQSSPDSPATPPPAIEGQGEHILVVEDEEALGQLLRDTLEHAGYKVSLAADRTNALDHLAHQPDIAVVLSDHEMPGLSAKAFLAQVQSRWPSLPVITMSGSMNAVAASSNPQWTAPPVLQKPFTRDALLSALRETLAKQPPRPH
jgi:signal transduction histidine kinase/ActR/RegA family two-component response regulator